MKINEGKAEAFLVYDDSFRKHECDFYHWLLSEGFSLGFHHGDFGCPWFHVSITKKRFAFGMPGFEIVPATGNHAITLEEFMEIYNIYKKYEGKELMKF